MRESNNRLYVLAQGAMIAAIYVVLTILFAPISFGPVQFRIAEALCILPFFTPAAVPGLFVGCLLSNLLCGAMPLELKYCLIAIVREALSNIMRHSNATAAQVSAVEFPGFYQMIVQDNGTRQAAGDRAGIGLRNMEERLAAFHGNLTVSRKNGFRLFITIPKEDVHEAADY